MPIRFRAAIPVLGIFALGQVQAVHACSTGVAWYADLTGSGETPVVTTAGKGRATFQFDFEHPVSTVTVSAQDLDDIQRVELTITIPGPIPPNPVATPGQAPPPGRSVTIPLYDATQSPFPGSITKTLTLADLPQTGQPLTMTDVANAVLTHKATVTIRTKAHPDGEIGGMIAMHKYAVYSDDPKSAFHDPTLHHAAQNAPPKP
jgi:hypothetical protein